MDNSLLGKLSPELRAIIYKLVLKQDKAIIVTQEDGMLRSQTDRYGNDFVFALTTGEKGYNMLALTMTCREIRDESIGVFYSSNAFKLRLAWTVWMAWPLLDRRCMLNIHSLVTSFLRTVGEENMQFLRNISMELPCDLHFPQNPETGAEVIHRLVSRFHGEGLMVYNNPAPLAEYEPEFTMRLSLHLGYHPIPQTHLQLAGPITLHDAKTDLEGLLDLLASNEQLHGARRFAKVRRMVELLVEKCSEDGDD